MSDSRRFVLVRGEDVSGVSGTGTVADGVEFPDLTVARRWRGTTSSTVIYDGGIGAVEKIHGHDGRTTVFWID